MILVPPVGLDCSDEPDHAGRHTPAGPRGGYPLRVDLINALHYGLVVLLGVATVATIWFACYVVYRLYSD
ncbi:hypothetical protein GCM10025787_42140 [Saccharopolyspora rosea]